MTDSETGSYLGRFVDNGWSINITPKFSVEEWEEWGEWYQENEEASGFWNEVNKNYDGPKIMAAMQTRFPKHTFTMLQPESAHNLLWSDLELLRRFVSEQHAAVRQRILAIPQTEPQWSDLPQWRRDAMLAAARDLLEQGWLISFRTPVGKYFHGTG